ncbi:hypothetical protein ACFZA9_12165 [Streptomyces olivaceus]|uniref:hypothetical protein n=1 Tax=Streptomyces olivaceus TaxID=47716 RepID=UPI0036E5741E
MSAPLVINTADGACWTRRSVTEGGVALYALADVCQCPEFVMATLDELAARGIAGSTDALPMPAGPEPRTEAERLAKQVVELQEELDTARFDAARARRERDEMRERVSEPFGCTHCGTTKRGHARRWTTGVGMHAWVAPTQGQIAERMMARRTVRLATDNDRLRARVAELEALAGQATEFRVWEPGYGLYVRRAPGVDGSGFAILEARRSDKGRRAWTAAGWQYSAVLAGEELFCWPDAQTAVAEARRVMPGAEVRGAGEAACCHLHKPDCCDPEDCGPCCMRCPTCPTLARQRAAEAGEGS